MTIRIRNIPKLAWFGWLAPARFVCVACSRRVGGFLPYRDGHRLLSDAMRELELNGSDLDRYECPRCGANDRFRHLLMYFDAGTIFGKLKGKRILHFAPETRLVPLIERAGPSRYVLADIAPSDARMSQVDMTAMSFEDAAFDVVIANHVLEHVDDLGAALRELARVLAPDGFAILQTPYSRRLRSTFADPGVDSDSARRVMYGQEDHVRLFGADIVSRIVEGSGLTARVSTHAELLPGIDPLRHGVNGDEPFFLFAKT